jgi:hypothetical protein
VQKGLVGWAANGTLAHFATWLDGKAAFYCVTKPASLKSLLLDHHRNFLPPAVCNSEASYRHISHRR